MDRRSLTMNVLAARARCSPGEVLIEDVGGEMLTYGSFQDLALRFADALESVGVGAAEPVLSIVTGLPGYWTWVGAGWLGAIHVPIDPDLRGSVLAAAIETTGARVLVVEQDQLDRLASVADELRGLDDVIVVDGNGDGAGRAAGRPRFHAGLALLDDAPGGQRPRVDLDGIEAGVFTSGTTGRSKCALRTWATLEVSGHWLLPTDPDGTTPGGGYYSPWPLFHALGLTALSVAVRRRLRLVHRTGFSASRYWADICEHRCTHAVWLVIAPILLGREAHPDDADNPLQHVTVVPLVRDVGEIESRFAVRVGTMYGQTETGPVLAATRPAHEWGVGRPVPGVEVDITDELGSPVGQDEVGELRVRRTTDPAALSTRYLGMPEAMDEKWDDGWFRTGDLFRRGASGTFQFVDRATDSIRHRGHNISSVELEREVLAHPEVIDCACVGVPSDLGDSDVFGEDDVKIVVVRSPGASFAPAELVAFLEPHVPRHMVPRFVEFVDDLPRTATGKARKRVLREQHDRLRSWDRTSPDDHQPAPPNACQDR